MASCGIWAQKHWIQMSACSEMRSETAGGEYRPQCSCAANVLRMDRSSTTSDALHIFVAHTIIACASAHHYHALIRADCALHSLVWSVKLWASAAAICHRLRSFPKGCTRTCVRLCS
jgi:hypothetical protein